MQSKTAISACVVTVAIAGLLIWAINQPARPSLCNVVHMTGSRCPPGYVREPHPRFIEKDGSREYACSTADATKETCVDAIYPGETMLLNVLPEEDPPPAKQPTKGPRT